MHVRQLLIDFIYVHLCPQNIKIAIYTRHHLTVQSIQLLQKVQFFLDSSQCWIFCHRETKQLFTSTVDTKLRPQLIKLTLWKVNSWLLLDLQEIQPILISKTHYLFRLMYNELYLISSWNSTCIIFLQEYMLWILFIHYW